MKIDKCRIINFPKIAEARGNLSFIEGNNHIPFPIKRVLGYVFLLYFSSFKKIKYAWAGKKHVSSLGIGRFGHFDMIFRKGTSDEPVLFDESFDNDIFFSGVPEYRSNDQHVIIDVGAYIGTFSILASSKVKHGKVYAVEASKETFKLLRINIALNEISNIEAFHLALGDSIGTCRLYHDTGGNWGHSTVKNYHSQSEVVECSTLEAFLDQNRIMKCDLMKLNCEGAEYPILLNSSVDVLQRFNVILVLYHNDLWTNNSESDLIRHLESCRFAITLRNQSEKRGWIIAVNKNVQTFSIKKLHEQFHEP